MPGIRVGRTTIGVSALSGSVPPVPPWEPSQPLGGETPSLWVKENSRSGLTLTDSVNVVNSPTITLPYIKKTATAGYAGVNDNGALDIGAADFTLWIKSKSETSAKTANRLIGGKSVSTSVNGRYGIYALATTGYVYAAIQSSSATYELTTTVDYTASGLCTIRIDINQTTKKMRMFVNNIQQGADKDYLGTFSAMNNGYRFYLGAQNTNTSGGVTIGSISSYTDCFVLKRLLTPSEAANAELGIFPSDVAAQYVCNSFHPADVSGNNLHMTGYNLTIDNIAYDTFGSPHLLNKGYKFYTNFGAANFYVPNDINGNVVTGPIVPDGFETFANYGRTGSTTNHNGADSLITFIGDKWDRSNETIYSGTARSGYYNAAIPTAWHPTELWSLNMSDFFNADQNRFTYSKWHLTNDHLLELFSYATTKIDADFKKALTYSNNYDSYHTLSYIFNDEHICTQRGAKILKNVANVLYLSINGGATYPYSIAQTGVICRAKIYENGNIMWCTQTQIFLSTDNLATKTEIIPTVNGVAFTPKASSNFTPLHENNVDIAGSMAIPDLWGMYSIVSGQEYDNCHVWCTTDYGVTVKSIYQFGVSEPILATRHFHNINRNPTDGSWWICTGDGNVDPDARIMRFVHDIESNTWTWAQLTESLYTGRFVTLGAAFKDNYFIWGNDYEDIYRAPYSDITVLADHEKVLLTGDGTSMYYDSTSDVMICYLSNTGSTIYTSSDGGRTFRKSTLTGGPSMAGFGGYTCCINKNSNGYYRYEIIQSTETLEQYTQGIVLMIKVNKV